MARIFVFRPQASEGAQELVHALPYGTRINRVNLTRMVGERVRNGAVTRSTPIQQGDAIVCWGAPLAPIPGVKVLNGTEVRSKFTDAVRLKEAAVATIEVSQTRPAAVPAVDPAIAVDQEVRSMLEDFLDTPIARSQPFRDGVAAAQAKLTELYQALGRAVPSQTLGEWLGRMNAHVGGNDLLTPQARPDFYARKENLTQEFRVHCFLGKSQRAGQKVPREGASSTHPWIRSYEAGWKVSYDGFESTKAMRELAKKACEALSLDFGAVDIGQKADGSLLVLEVNRAPGVENGTVDAYARAITGWLAAPTAAPGAPRAASQRA